MKTTSLLTAGLVILLSSCSTAYKIGQTPDDVYYSPAPVQEEYVTTNSQEEKDSYGYNNQSYGYTNQDYGENLAIRRGIINPAFRNYNSMNLGYGYDPYAYTGSSLYSPYFNSYPYGYSGVTFYPNSYYNSYNAYSPYSSYTYYGSYSPYNYYAPLYINSKPGNAAGNYSGPRRYDLGAYNVNTGVGSGNVNPRISNNGTVPARTFTAPRPTNTTGTGNFIRRIFTPNDNNNDRNTYINNNRSSDNYNNNRATNNNRDNTPARSFQPSSGGNTNSSPAPSSSAPVRTFRK